MAGSLREPAIAVSSRGPGGWLGHSGHRRSDPGRGNLINRTAALNARNAGREVEPDDFAADTIEVTAQKINSALSEFDFRGATEAIRQAVAAGNRYVEDIRPWAIDRPEKALATLTALGYGLADQVEPFLPSGADRLRARLDGSLNPPFRRLHRR
jgi:methionyl-tRNA synthetase